MAIVALCVGVAALLVATMRTKADNASSTEIEALRQVCITINETTWHTHDPDSDGLDTLDRYVYPARLLADFFHAYAVSGLAWRPEAAEANAMVATWWDAIADTYENTEPPDDPAEEHELVHYLLLHPEGAEQIGAWLDAFDVAHPTLGDEYRERYATLGGAALFSPEGARTVPECLPAWVTIRQALFDEDTRLAAWAYAPP